MNKPMNLVYKFCLRTCQIVNSEYRMVNMKCNYVIGVLLGFTGTLILDVFIAPDKALFQQKNTDIILILFPQKHMLWYSLEAPCVLLTFLRRNNAKVLLVSHHNICFHEEIRNLFYECLLLSGAAEL